MAFVARCSTGAATFRRSGRSSRASRRSAGAVRRPRAASACGREDSDAGTASSPQPTGCSTRRCSFIRPRPQIILGVLERADRRRCRSSRRMTSIPRPAASSARAPARQWPCGHDPRTADGVAIIPVLDTLVNRGAWLDSRSGLTSYEGIAAQTARGGVRPGGTVGPARYLLARWRSRRHGGSGRSDPVGSPDQTRHRLRQRHGGVRRLRHRQRGERDRHLAHLDGRLDRRRHAACRPLRASWQRRA